MKTKRMSFGAAGALFALLSVLLILAACGGDGDDADPAATEPAAEDPTATEPADAQPTDEPDPTVTEPGAAGTTIDVTLTEFVVASSDGSAPPGTITFNVSSEGAIPHNLRVIATDLAADALPLDDTGFAVDEEQVTVVGSTADLNPGDAEELTLNNLEAGDYVLICNVPTHYDLAMRVAFTVE